MFAARTVGSRAGPIRMRGSTIRCSVTRLAGGRLLANPAA